MKPRSTDTHDFAAAFAVALLILALAALGGSWGTALGQTAGPPPTRPPGGAAPVYPAVTPLPAAEYRPAPSSPSPTTPSPVGQPVVSPTRPAARVTPTPAPIPTAPAVSGSVQAEPQGKRTEAGGPASGQETESNVLLLVAVVSGGVALLGTGVAGWWYLGRPR